SQTPPSGTTGEVREVIDPGVVHGSSAPCRKTVTTLVRGGEPMPDRAPAEATADRAPVGRADAPPRVPTPWTRSVFAAELWSILALGTVVLAIAVGGLVAADGAQRPVALLALVALVVFGELRPVVTSRSYGEGTTPSIAFTFAIMFVWGPWPAILAQALASLVADVAARKVWWRTAFNPAQYAVS